MKISNALIFGCGGHSRSVVDILLSYQPQIEIEFIDELAKNNEFIFGFSVVSKPINLDKPYFFAVGNNEKRKILYEQFGSADLFSIVSKTAHLGKNSHISKGVFIGNFSHIGPEASIEDNVILNNGCIIEHEVSIGKHSHIGPRSVISGRSKIGESVFIGVGAVVKDSICICSNVIIGAGAVVVKNIAEPGIYVGCPAKKIKPIPLES